jgi:outer membrane lipoprotein-sorting protein
MISRRTLTLALLGALPLLSQELSLDQIIQKHIDATGGLQAWRDVKSMSASAKASMMGGQLEMALSMKQKRPSMMRMDFSVQGTAMVRATDGATAWQINPMAGSKDAAKVSGKEAEELNESADMDGPLVDYREKGHAIELVGREEVEGTSAYKLKVARKNGRQETHWIDAASFLVVKTQTRTTQMGQEMEIESFPGNYKKVGAVLMPHTLEQKVNGKSLMTMTFEKFDLNPQIDDAEFKMPAPPAEEKKN